ncbi:sugar phosphate isomerase/epimerase family protein [Kitasatospora xanthocidica]|uniref:sugar phosphate isomerase/epimerase family protein n=1 Tax=Kitasatospora xanthocidica TaxID=83382 RepID=UPI00227D8852|nr:sugar phosphate isomerase/epimerase family protein [Kitasatospora xanthocidica]
MPRVTIQPRLHDLSRYVNAARSNDFHFELIEPAYPQNLDMLDEYFSDFLEKAGGAELVKVLHGPYIDISVHSPDRAVRAASAERISASIEWAKRLGAEFLILHSNHLPMLNEPAYDRQWRAGWLDFLRGQDLGDVTVLLENMWDRTPDLSLSLVEEFDSPRLRLCFDVAHWNVHGTVPLEDWLRRAGAATAYVQYGDNHGDQDSDLALGSGTVDWPELDRCLRAHAPHADVMVGVGIDDADERLQPSIDFLRAGGIHPFPPHPSPRTFPPADGTR